MADHALEGTLTRYVAGILPVPLPPFVTRPPKNTGEKKSSSIRRSRLEIGYLPFPAFSAAGAKLAGLAVSRRSRFVGWIGERGNTRENVGAAFGCGAVLVSRLGMNKAACINRR